MPTFKPGDIIKVPFPHVEKTFKRFRPALVVSSPELQDVHDLHWVLMITSAANRPWAGDIEITDLTSAGLPAPSVIRCAKIATIESAPVTKIGELSIAEWKLVQRMIKRVLGDDAT